ncbi:MAG TPA: ABC transporter permease, partial [Micromonosporaceae bacterium]|nr:ABC transporter permease [Micromonosporaceae bacterium]
MSLFRTEVRRLRKRRFVRYMTLAGVLVLLAVVAGTFFTNKSVTAEQIAAAKRTAEQHYQQNIAATEQFRRDCERVQAGGGSAEEKAHFPPDCAMIQPPSREEFNFEWFMPPSFDFRGEFEPMITTFAAILALVAFVAGASFVGAEWNTGGMMNLLLWRPRRLQVLLTKLAAVLT